MKILVILLFLFVYVEFSELKNLDEVGEAPATDISTLSTISSTSTETQSTPVQDGTTLSSVQSENPSSSPKPDLKEKLDLSDVIVKNSSNMNISLIDNLSNQIRIILKHFQHPDPIGLPGKSILPEPMLAENVTASLVVATGSFFNIEIYGLNNFSISVINTFLDRMEVFVVLRLKSATALGNYTITNMVVNNEGPFNITFTNVTAAGTVGLAINEQGQLYANKSAIDISYEEMEVDLTNVSAFVRPFLNSGGAQIFNAEKKYILDNVNERLMAEINRRLEFFPKIPPLTKISPVDLAVMEGRKFVKSRYEPYIIDKVFDFDNPFLSINVGPVSIQGLSKFAHVGNISLDMVNQTVDLRIRIITSKLLGNCKWYYDIGKVGVTRHGQSNFSISHLQFEARVRQPVDSRKPPVLEELEIETGPIYVKMDGRGSFDYIVEMVVKMLPKMLRHMIIDALEEPIKQKIQTDVLDRISVERVYEENLPDIKKYLSDKI